MNIRIGKAGTLLFEDNYRVISPPAEENGLIPDFVDIQHYPLKNGTYTLTLSITDVQDPDAEPSTVSQEVTIKHLKNQTSLSDIQVLSRFVKSEKENVLTKGGYDLIPYSSDFIPPHMTQLAFYVEAYNLKSNKKNEQYLIDSYIIDPETELVIGDFRKYFMKPAIEGVTPLLHSFPIAELPSGTYALVVEIRDRKNEQLGQSTFTFTRSNHSSVDEASDQVTSSGALEGTFVAKLGNKKKLERYIRCHYPIAKVPEVRTIEKRSTITTLR